MNRNHWLTTWRAADNAANEAMRAVALQSRLALEHLGQPPSQEDVRHADGLREVADALLQQATAAMRTRSATVLSSPRLGYDEMWNLALCAVRTEVGCTRV